MYSIAWYFDSVFLLDARYGAVATIDFFILVISTVIIAAAGNIINDYFDIKADRVNRPERIIIARHIKPRVAILAHWTMNLIAFSMAIYLSYKSNSFWYLFIHLFSINLLWFYSMQFKRTLYIGNISVAILTGLVPVLVGIYYNQQLDFGSIVSSLEIGEKKSYFPFEVAHPERFTLLLGFVFGGFAFLLNWAREIVKDMEDTAGDKKLGARTIPLVFGFRRAKNWAAILLTLSAAGTLVMIVLNKSILEDWFAFLPLLPAAISALITLFLLFKSNDKSSYRRTHKSIKLIMVFGMLLPLWWGILLSIA
jgi:4-hydroxybenzoate polyprenyltransferase